VLGAALAALCMMAGCVVTEKQVNNIVAARMADTQKQVDEKLAAVRADLTAANMKTENVLNALAAIQKQSTQNRESLRLTPQAQSVALEQQKRAVDMALDRIKASAPPPAAAPAPAKPQDALSD
jgi:hypothetical protein